MNDTTKLLRNMIKRILRPLVRILLRNQVSISEFIDQVKEVYVEVAEKDFAIPHKKNTTSRTSVITGLSRKEVLRVKNLQECLKTEETQYKLNKACTVITGWLKDSDFTDATGNAVDLSLKDEPCSFETLVKRYGGDTTYRAVLDELISMGSVVKVPATGLLRLTNFGYVPEEKIERLEIMSKCASDFFETVSYNLEHQPHESHFQRQLTYTELPISVVNEFKEFSKEKSLELLFELNKWLAEQKSKLSDSDKTNQILHRTGMGIYYIHNDEQKDSEDV